MTIGVLNQALLGIQRNQRRFERAAGDIVRSSTVGQDPVAYADSHGGAQPPDFAQSAVNLMTAQRGLEACLAVARTGDEMLGTVIDMLA